MLKFSIKVILIDDTLQYDNIKWNGIQLYLLYTRIMQTKAEIETVSTAGLFVKMEHSHRNHSM